MRAPFVSTRSSPDLTANVKVILPSIHCKLCYLSWEVIDGYDADFSVELEQNPATAMIWW